MRLSAFVCTLPAGIVSRATGTGGSTPPGAIDESPSPHRRPRDRLCDHWGVAKARRRWTFYASLPERGVRAGAAGLGGALHETFELALPRFMRRSRFYEATAKNLLRVAIELVGGVERPPAAEPQPSAREIAKRKGAGNIVELGSIAAFGFSPLWLLAAASDLTRGSRVYLNALTHELKAAGLLAEDVDAGSVDELLGVLERTSGGTAQLIDIPPLELRELRASLVELRAQADSLPSSDELAALYSALRRTAEAENKTLLEVSSGVGLAFLTSARKVSGAHVVAPYREDWQPLRDEGFGAYARRVGAPYGEAVARHFQPHESTKTERLLDRVATWRSRRPR
jgi:hypothetical protein